MVILLKYFKNIEIPGRADTLLVSSLITAIEAVIYASLIVCPRSAAIRTFTRIFQQSETRKSSHAKIDVISSKHIPQTYNDLLDVIFVPAFFLSTPFLFPTNRRFPSLGGYTTTRSQGQNHDITGFVQPVDAPPAQYLSWIPISLGQQDNTELKSQIQTLRTESQSLREMVNNLRKEANETKIKLSVAESRIEEYGKKNQSVLTITERPILNSPLLKALEVISIKDQIVYIGSCVEESLPSSAIDGQCGIDEARLAHIQGKHMYRYGYRRGFTSVKELLIYITKNCYGLDVDLD
ncbi:hypothetical protein LTR05_006651 [Lithohypha guttulata]|uniref:Uncharacterized protein n=1 Tax=Lithohypha guttulata TaxID=1690604 RepID=A0AAN7SVK7_9EURO|nr:hypothetical protein LTR05_006651 [Lithohypha guttulata]